MGVTVELEDSDLWCRSAKDATNATELITKNEWISTYNLQVTPSCSPSGERQGKWFLEVTHFQGDHWRDDEARRVWLRIAPHMADGATLEFQGEGSERWRIRWQWEGCDACSGAAEVARGSQGAPYARCGRCDGLGEVVRVFEEYVTDVIWAVGQEITATQEEEAS